METYERTEARSSAVAMVSVTLAIVAAVLLSMPVVRAADPLAQPDRISCVGYEADTVWVRWADVDGADDYRVERQIGGGDWEEVATVTESDYRETGVGNPPARRYRVRAYRASDDSYSPRSAVCNGRRIYETKDIRIFYGLEGTDDCPQLGSRDVCLPDDEDSEGNNIYVKRAADALQGSVDAFERLGFDRSAGEHDKLDKVPVFVIWCDGGGCLAQGDRLGLAPRVLTETFDLDTRTGDPEPWVVSLHEMFHFQQRRYPGLSDPKSQWVYEGQARSIQDKICIGADRSDCEAFDDIDGGFAGYVPEVNAYLGNPDSTPINRRSYRAVLFWTYLTEKFGGTPDDPVEEGMNFIIKFWQEAAADPGRDGISVIDGVLEDLGYAARFRDAWKDFAVANYAKDYDGPAKYQYEDMGQPGGSYDKVDLNLDRALAVGDQVVQQDVLYQRSWTPRYYEVQPAADLPLIDIQVTQYSSAPVYYTVLGIRDGEIIEEHNEEGRHLSYTMVNSGYDRVALVVATMERAVNYTYSFNGTQPLLKIVAPTAEFVARVGEASAPGKFRVAVEVLGPDGTPLEGVQEDGFSFRVGSKVVAPEEILTAAPVSGQNWFVVRAPSQEHGGSYDFEASYGGVLTSTENSAVRYEPRDSADNVIVIDRSGSMGAEQNGVLEAAQAAARLYVDSWHPGDQVGLIKFNQIAELEMGLTPWSAQGDGFGSSLAAADFDQDGQLDLAIGVPWEGVGAEAEAGSVNVLYGTGSGLSASGDQIWSQDTGGVAGGSEARDSFGASLATGDFDQDGYPDLAIGAPGESVDGVRGAGAVNVLYGSDAGLSEAGDQLWTQNSPGVLAAAKVDAAFGRALAAGDFDDDGYVDLAIGIPGFEVGGDGAAGAVAILHGSDSGLTATGSQHWSQDTAGVDGQGEPDDEFGDALAAGDFDGDGYDDLAVGVHQEALGGYAGAGAVNVLYGSSGGLSTVGDQVWSQGSSGIGGAVEEGDGFGSALAAGDFDNDGYADLAVGAPGESVAGEAAAGAVNIIYGTSGGLSSASDQLWHQGSADVNGLLEPQDQFGASLAAGDFDQDGDDDLAIGVPGESVAVGTSGQQDEAGAINVLYGTGGGLSATGDQIWSQESDSVAGLAEVGDRFGYAVVAGDFDGDGYDDLAVGVPGEDVTTLAEGNAGAVNVLYGGSGTLAAAGNQIWTQDSGGVNGLAEPSSREFALDVINGLVADGATALGDALQAGWDELVDHARTGNEWAIVLLSDGIETDGELDFGDVIDSLRQTDADGDKIPAVHSVAVGPDADQAGMQRASRVTDGLYQYVALPSLVASTQGADGVSQAEEAEVYFDLAEAHRMAATEVTGRQPYLRLTGPVRVNATEEARTIPVESGASELVISLNWVVLDPGTELETYVLRDPDGRAVEPFSANAGTAGHAVWRLEDPQGGDWTLELDAKAGDLIRLVPPYMIQAAVRSEVTMDVHLDTPADQPVAGLPVTLLAALTDNGPITGASIVGLIEPQSSSAVSVTLPLYDDGEHGDGAAGDGLYGAIYRDTQTNVSYQVEIRADGVSPLSGSFHRRTTFSFYATADDGDGDGLPDAWEIYYGTDPTVADAGEDPDFDGLPNSGEFDRGSDPLNPDTDGGGAADGSDISPNDPSNDTVEPTWAVAEPRDSRVLVRYALPQDYARVDIYRGDNREGPFSHLEGVFGDGVTGIYTDTAVTNDTTYCYVLVARASNFQDTNTEPTCATPKADPWPPHGTVEIEDPDDDGAVPSPDVTLELWASDSIDPEEVAPGADLPPESSATEVTHMLISNRADFQGATWEAYQTSKAWRLAATQGRATVYVKYRDAADNESELTHATIRIVEDSTHEIYLPITLRQG